MVPYVNPANYASWVQITGFPQARETMENLENHKKSSMHGKIMEFEKKHLNNHGKIMEFCEIIWENPPVARKLAVRHTKRVCLTASFLATGMSDS